jgi:hypothetical protein
MLAKTFQVKKVYRPRPAAIAGVAALFLGGMTLGVSGVGQRASTTCIILGALASWVVVIAMSTESEKTLAVADGALTASWRSRPLRPRTVRIGHWVLPQTNTPMGIVAHVRGPGGSLRIGTREAAAGAYPIDGPRAQWVDCHLGSTDFGLLLEGLGVQSVPASTAEAVELLARRGGLRTIAPWFLTMLVAVLVGLGLRSLGVSQSIMAVAMVVVLFAGMAVTMLLSWRVREPTRELRLEAERLTMVRRRGGTQIASAAWADVRAMPSTGVMRMSGRSFVYPTLAIDLGPAHTIVVGAWNSDLAWSDPMDRQRRKARWLVGNDEWHRLVRVLQSHDCMR